MKFSFYLEFFLLSCTAHHKESPPEQVVTETTYTEGTLEQYTEFQRRCDEILDLFRRRELLFSIEPFEERRSLVLDIIAFDPGVYLPKSLDACLSELESY